MTKILIYDIANNYFEVFYRDNKENMPYAINNSIDVETYCDDHNVCWVTKQLIQSINDYHDLSVQPSTITSCFHRIFEKGYANAYSHLGGIAIDIKNDSIENQLLLHRLLSREAIFESISDPDHTPFYLHCADDYTSPCSEFVRFPTLILNDINTFVCVLQDALITLGYLNSEYINGTFDALTQKKVINFQREFGLRADGVVGCETWQTLSYIIKMGNRPNN